MNTPHLWEQHEAIATAATFEAILQPAACHVALGGSCVYRGWSDKDIDIFVCGHKPPLTSEQLDLILRILASHNYTLRNTPATLSATPEYFRQVLQLQDLGGRSIDLFVMKG